ncbi:YybH family protein [Lentisalinibacter salinarum]
MTNWLDGSHTAPKFAAPDPGALAIWYVNCLGFPKHAIYESGPYAIRQIIEKWVDCFNRADADAIADCYSKDATNHQVVRDPVVGREAIREMFAREFAKATMVCQIENIFQDGEWGILEWVDPNGLRGYGHRCQK